MEMNNPLLWTMALTSVCAGVQAQTDVTDTYIKNSTISSNADWLHTGFNNFANDCAEAFSGSGGNVFSIRQVMTLPAGAYRLVGSAFYRQGSNALTAPDASKATMFAGDKSITVRPLASEPAVAGNPSGYSGGYVNNMSAANEAFGNGLYKNVLDFVLEEETTLEIGFKGTHDNGSSWFIVGDVKLYNLSLDATSAIANPSFESGNLDGWVNNGFQTQNNASYEDKVGSHYAEKWQANGSLPSSDLHQELSLPAGKYSLSVRGRFDGNGFYLYAGDRSVQIKRGTATIDNIVVDDKPLTVGVKLDGATSNWVRFDDFHLSVDMGNIPGELSQQLAIQINRMNGIAVNEGLDDRLSGLTLGASKIQGDINGFNFEDYKNYKEGNDKSLSVRIDSLTNEIDNALANYNAKKAADEAYADMRDALTSLANYIDTEVGKDYKAAAQKLYNDLDVWAEGFKGNAAEAYASGDLGKQADLYAQEAAAIIESIADAKTTIATGDKNMIAYQTVLNAIGAAKATYNNKYLIN